MLNITNCNKFSGKFVKLLKILKLHAVIQYVSKQKGETEMSIKFNDFNNGYNNYNLRIAQGKVKENEKPVEEVKENMGNEVFKGLENETDLLTQNAQYVYVSQFGITRENREIAEETNAILASLGYDYKVTAAQAASVANGVRNTVLPGLKSVDDSAVAARIQDPDGPFADLFA